jgi:dihydroflavonol-4-reductase
MTSKGLVLVTGGSGYIAGFVIRQLLGDGWNVRATLRDLKREGEVRTWIGGLAADPAALAFAKADLGADAGWPEAAAGADYVLHVASPIPASNPKNDDELVIPAREGTLRVLRAARDAGVKRIVVTSSTAAICYGRGSRAKAYTEAEWSDPTNLADTSAYERSKTLAERAAWDFIAREASGLELTTVNPGAVIGPVVGRDFSASLEIVKKLLDGSMPGLPRMGWPLVDVRDIADLHIRAMTADGAAGERFLGAGKFLWLKDIAAILKQRMPAQSAKVPSLNLPDWLVRVASTFDATIRSRLFELGKERPADSGKARTRLGWSPRPLEDTIADCAQSLIDQGIVAAKR